MNIEKQKAKKLWHYLKIQDEHLLIRVGSPSTQSERALIVRKNRNGGLHFSYVKIPPEGFNKWIGEYGQPFTLVQQRDDNGCFFVPDVDEWMRDEHIDY